jgi:hypothetical protein
MNTVSRFALPPAVCPAREVATTVVFPFTVTERSLSQSFAGVESLPDGCTLATTSFAGDPFGIMTLPPTITSLETFPTTPCPTFAVFELTVRLVVTLMEVPAGIVVVAESRNGKASRAEKQIVKRLNFVFISVTSKGIDLRTKCSKKRAARGLDVTHEFRGICFRDFDQHIVK